MNSSTVDPTVENSPLERVLDNVPPRPGAQPRRSRWLARRSPWFWLALIPLMWCLAFFGYPLVHMLIESTESSTGTGGLLENYRWFFTDDVQLQILLRTFTTALIVATVTLFVGAPYAYLMTLVSNRWKTVMLALVLLPFWSSVIVRSYAWSVLFQDSGPISKLLEQMGFSDVRILGTNYAVIIASVQVLLPFLILPLHVSLSSIDRTLLRAAEMLGATPATAFRRVYVPLAVPGIAAGFTTVFVLMLGFFFTPALLGSPRNSLISQQLYLYADRMELGRAATLGMVLLVVTLVLVGLSAWAMKRIGIIGGRR